MPDSTEAISETDRVLADIARTRDALENGDNTFGAMQNAEPFIPFLPQPEVNAISLSESDRVMNELASVRARLQMGESIANQGFGPTITPYHVILPTPEEEHMALMAKLQIERDEQRDSYSKQREENKKAEIKMQNRTKELREKIAEKTKKAEKEYDETEAKLIKQMREEVQKAEKIEAELREEKAKNATRHGEIRVLQENLASIELARAQRLHSQELEKQQTRLEHHQNHLRYSQLDIELTQKDHVIMQEKRSMKNIQTKVDAAVEEKENAYNNLNAAQKKKEELLNLLNQFAAKMVSLQEEIRESQLVSTEQNEVTGRMEALMHEVTVVSQELDRLMERKLKQDFDLKLVLERCEDLKKRNAILEVENKKLVDFEEWWEEWRNLHAQLKAETNNDAMGVVLKKKFEHRGEFVYWNPGPPNRYWRAKDTRNRGRWAQVL